MEEYLVILMSALGYFISLFVGGFMVKKTIDLAWKMIDYGKSESTERGKYGWTTEMVGYLERFIYTTSVIFGVKELFAAWLVLKLSSQWVKWGGVKNLEKPKNVNLIFKRQKDEEQKYKSRAIFQIFLLGTGLSLVYGLLGGQVAIWLSQGKCLYSYVSVVFIVSLNLIIICCIKVIIKKNLYETEKK
jgi:hypothetical protein